MIILPLECLLLTLKCSYLPLKAAFYTQKLTFTGYQVINTYLFCENTYLIHTHFPPKYIPFTYLWAPKIHTFLSFSASFLAQPMTRRQWRKTEWKSRLDWVRGVQFLRGKSFVLGHSKAFWASSPFQLAGKHSCEGSFTYLFDQIHTFYIPNFWKRYVYIPRYVNTYPTSYPAFYPKAPKFWD